MILIRENTYRLCALIIRIQFHNILYSILDITHYTLVYFDERITQKNMIMRNYDPRDIRDVSQQISNSKGNSLLN